MKWKPIHSKATPSRLLPLERDLKDFQEEHDPERGAKGLAARGRFAHKQEVVGEAEPVVQVGHIEDQPQGQAPIRPHHQLAELMP